MCKAHPLTTLSSPHILYLYCHLKTLVPTVTASVSVTRLSSSFEHLVDFCRSAAVSRAKWAAQRLLYCMKQSGSWRYWWHIYVAQFKCSIKELFVKIRAECRGSKWKWVSFRIIDLFQTWWTPERRVTQPVGARQETSNGPMRKRYCQSRTTSREEPANEQSTPQTLDCHPSDSHQCLVLFQTMWVSCLEPRITSEREKGGPGEARRCVESLSWFNMLEIQSISTSVFFYLNH